MSTPAEWTVGQTVYVRWTRDRNRSGVVPSVIEKVGRKWVTLQGDYRFDRNDPRMVLDGGGSSSPGRVYRTREEYEDRQRRHDTWMNFLTQVRTLWDAPKDVSIETLEQVTLLLGFKPLEKEPPRE